MYLTYICVAISTATDVRAIAITPRSVEVTWKVSSAFDITGYLISYTTTASYASGGSVTVNGGSTTSGTLRIWRRTLSIPSLYKLLLVIIE